MKFMRSAVALMIILRSACASYGHIVWSPFTAYIYYVPIICALKQLIWSSQIAASSNSYSSHENEGVGL